MIKATAINNISAFKAYPLFVLMHVRKTEMKISQLTYGFTMDF